MSGAMSRAGSVRSGATLGRRGALRRLVVGDLLTDAAVWAGALVVTIGAAFAAMIPATLVETGVAHLAGDRPIVGFALLAVAGTVIVFTLVALVVVVSSAVRAMVDLRRASFALWQTAGVLPGQVGRVVAAELVVVAVVGALAGVAMGAAAAPGFVAFGLVGAPGLGGVQPVVGPLASAVVFVVVVAVVTASGAPAARSASRTPPVRLLSAPDDRRTPHVALRTIGAVALLALAAQMLVSLPASTDTGGSQSVLIGPVLVAATGLGGFALVRRAARVWSAIVPERASVAFSIARAAVVRTRDASTAIVPFFVAVALPLTFTVGGRVFALATATATATATAAAAAAGPVGPGGDGGGGGGGTLLVLAGPSLLAAVGGVATLVMRTRGRERDAALLASLGAGSATRSAVRVFEVLIVVVTAVLMAAVLAAVVALLEAVVLAGI